MPYYPVPAYICFSQPCIQSIPSYMNAQATNFAPNMPTSSNFSSSNDPEQLLIQDRTNATLLASSNLQIASESINNSTQPPNIYAGGIPEQNHMENPSVPTLTYIVLNKDNDVVFEINNHEIFKVIISLCRKDEIRRLEYFYPLLDHDYTISFQNILDCRKKINNITNSLNTHVEMLFNTRKYEIGFMCNLMKKFRLKAPFIFHAKNRPMIYCKPLFLLFPLWIEDTIQNELMLAKHIFYISLLLNVTKAIMKYNYECLKPFIDQNIRENKQVGFSYHFSSQKSLIYNHFNLIIKFFEDIFIILGGEAYYKIFKCATEAEFLVDNCDNVFSSTFTYLEISVILFDVLKTSQENKDLKFKSYIKKTLNEESYLQNENCRKLYYNLVSIYERVFQSKRFCDFIQNPFSINFKVWFRENMVGLRCMLLKKIVPRYFDIRNFLTACNTFLHYICKVSLNPDLTPTVFEDILVEKIVRFLQVKNFE
ncbi:hypothetical protein CWI39_0067p0010 [Hamiltosporidium magnivora]|uniref:Uncharacterized protein n=1 Tax=Hamiltosporidium magnivora TaxID=148818 RepID=A0A4Q9LQ49_9MICR|nr:hypothetical protein CWI39_0067p0010 [Hamiltosporidium magnivora]